MVPSLCNNFFFGTWRVTPNLTIKRGLGVMVCAMVKTSFRPCSRAEMSYTIVLDKNMNHSLGWCVTYGDVHYIWVLPSHEMYHFHCQMSYRGPIWAKFDYWSITDVPAFNPDYCESPLAKIKVSAYSIFVNLVILRVPHGHNLNLWSPTVGCSPTASYVMVRNGRGHPALVPIAPAISFTHICRERVLTE